MVTMSLHHVKQRCHISLHSILIACSFYIFLETFNLGNCRVKLWKHFVNCCGGQRIVTLELLFTTILTKFSFVHCAHLHQVHSMNFVSVKMHDPPQKNFFAWNWWNTSQWHPITWIWPLECSRKSQFWRSLKWHGFYLVNLASKNCLSGLYFFGYG